MGTQKKRNKQNNKEIEPPRQTTTVPQKLEAYEFDANKKHVSNNRKFVFIVIAIGVVLIICAVILSMAIIPAEERWMYLKYIKESAQERGAFFVYGVTIGLSTRNHWESFFKWINGETKK